MHYEKPATSILEQIEILKNRGMVFTDIDTAQHQLSIVGYYRLSVYWLPFYLPESAEIPKNSKFKKGTTFTEIEKIYLFDRQLRLLVMEAIEHIEVTIRTKWANAIALQNEPHSYMKAELFSNPWQHTIDIAQIAKNLEKSSETFITHYRNTYKHPFLPPIWAMVETLSLGALSRWFKATNNKSMKKEIARELGIPSVEILETVLHTLTLIRNICAHHGRLWNRQLTSQLPYIKRLKNQIVIEKIDANNINQPSRHIFNYLLVINCLIQKINPTSDWRSRCKQHIKNIDIKHQLAMGFPEGWENYPLWQDSSISII